MHQHLHAHSLPLGETLERLRGASGVRDVASGQDHFVLEFVKGSLSIVLFVWYKIGVGEIVIEDVTEAALPLELQRPLETEVFLRNAAIFAASTTAVVLDQLV